MADMPATQEVAAGRAFEVESRIKVRVRRIREEWVHLAADLYEFQQIDGWLALGHSSQEAWLADPEIDLRLSRTQVYRLLAAHQQLVIERGVSVEQLAAVDSSKVWEVLPAIRRNQVDAATALADCEVLGQTDLRDKYRPIPATSTAHVNDRPIEPDDFHYENCSECGQRVRVQD